MRQSTRVILNSLFSIGQQLLTIAIQVFLLAFVLRRVKSDAYAIFLLAGGIQAVLFAFRDAISTGCVTHVVRYREEHDQEKINKVISTASMFLLAPAIVVMVASVFAGPGLSRFFHIRPELHSTMNWVALLIGVNVLFSLPLFPFRSTIEAHQRYDLIAYVNVGARLVRAGLIVAAFLLLRADVLYVMVATVIVDVGTQCVMYLFARRLTPSLRVRLKLFDRTMLKVLLGFGSFLVLTSLVAIGTAEGTKWIIGKMLSLEYITYLTIAIYFIAVITMVVRTMTLVLVPVASRYKSLKADSVLAEMLLRGTRYSAVLSMGFVSVLLPVITPLISLWLGAEYAWLGPYAAVLGAFGGIHLLQECSRHILVGTGDSKRPFAVKLVGGLVTIGTVVLAAGVFRLGFAGAVLGLCAGWMTIWVGMTFFVLRAIPVSRARFAWHGYLQPILAALPAGAAGWVLSRFLPVHNWPGLLGVCALSFVTYVLCFLPFVTGQEWAIIRAVRGHIKGAFSSRPK